MAVTVFPETGDAVTEATWSALNDALAAGSSWTASGLDVTVDSGLDISVAAGTALVSGYAVVLDAAETVTVTDDDDTYVWLGPDGVLTANVTGVNPGDALLLAVVTAASGSITAISRNQSVTSGAFQMIRKGSDESVTSSTTLQADDELTVSLQPGVYRLTGLLKATWPASVGLKVALSTTATGANVNAAVIFSNSSGSTPSGWGFITVFGGGAGGEVAHGTNAGANDPVMIDGMLAVAGAGSVTLQWAQKTSGAATTIHAESMLYVERIS